MTINYFKRLYVQINFHSDNGRDFGGSIYHKVKPGLEGAINLAWNSSNNVTQFGIATKYNLDNDASVRAKVNSQLQIGLGYQQKLREGILIFLFFMIIQNLIQYNLMLVIT